MCCISCLLKHQQLDAMASWRDANLPYFTATRTLSNGSWSPAPGIQCPADLAALLAVNKLRPDETTVRDGNCGVDAFARSLDWQQGRRRILQSMIGRGSDCDSANPQIGCNTFAIQL